MGKLYVRSIDGDSKEGGMGCNDWDIMPSECVRLGIRVVHRRHASILARRRRGIVHIKSALRPGRLPAVSRLKTVSIAGHVFKGAKIRSRNKRVIHGFYHRQV